MKFKWKRETFLQEGKLTVDRENHIIKDVKILGYKSLNGRRYTENAVDQAAKLYEGQFVNFNHLISYEDRTKGRQVEQRFGWLEKTVHRKGHGAFGDLHYNPHHTDADTVLWWAENKPAALGLSHDADGEGKKDDDGEFVVESVTYVEGVDLVADPATTNGLFESVLEDPSRDQGNGSKGGNDVELNEVTLAMLKAKRPDLIESFNKEQQDSAEQKLLVKRAEDAETKLQESEKKLADIEKLKNVRALCTEAKLTEEQVSAIFLEQLVAAPDEPRIKDLIADRVKSFGGKLPESAGRLPESKAPDSPDPSQSAGAGLKEMELDKFVTTLRG